MKFLLQQIKADTTYSPVADIVFAGAGSGNELPYLRALLPTRLILLEANPRLAEDLVHRLHGEQSERLIPQALAARAGTADLYLLNNPRESGLVPPAQLVEHFPNLRVQLTQPVSAVDLDTLAAQLALDPELHNGLVLDIPGLAHAVLASASLEVLHAFDWLIIRTGLEPLYENDVPADTITLLLDGLGFDEIAESPDALYPHTIRLYRRNSQRAGQQRLEHELQQARLRIRELEDQLRDREGRLVALEAELDEFRLTQSLINDEMSRSEAQLELIKHVLLQEMGRD